LPKAAAAAAAPACMCASRARTSDCALAALPRRRRPHAYTLRRVHTPHAQVREQSSAFRLSDLECASPRACQQPASLAEGGSARHGTWLSLAAKGGLIACMPCMAPVLWFWACAWAHAWQRRAVTEAGLRRGDASGALHAAALAVPGLYGAATTPCHQPPPLLAVKKQLALRRHVTLPSRSHLPI